MSGKIPGEQEDTEELGWMDKHLWIAAVIMAGIPVAILVDFAVLNRWMGWVLALSLLVYGAVLAGYWFLYARKAPTLARASLPLFGVACILSLLALFFRSRDLKGLVFFTSMGMSGAVMIYYGFLFGTKK